MIYKRAMKTNTTIINPVRNSYTPRLIALGAIAALLLCALARAHGQPAEKTAINPVGTYALVSVDGKTVPGTINHEGTAMNVQSGTFTISTNSQITCVMTVSVGDRKDIRIETRATYTVKDAELTMKWQNAGMTRGSLAGQTFTMTNEGMAFVYQK
jgi:hypothetical protein